MGLKEARLNVGSRFELNDDEFLELSSLIERQIGIHFPWEKRREFQMKLQKLPPDVFRGTTSELIEAATVSDDILGKITNILTVGETYFFRNRPHFAALKSNILPEIISEAEERQRLRIWSAGCSTGEEPYSLSILLQEHFSYMRNWDISIVATDINTDFLAIARAGVYRKWSMRGIDQKLLRHYFHEDAEGNYTLRDNIRRTVTFKQFNLTDLLHGARPMADNIDLVLCRNVLIYFPFRTGNDIINAMLTMIRPGGYLMVGHSESFPSLGNFEVIHAHATYYYRRYKNEQTALLSMPAPETTTIPGIAVRSTYMPAAFAATASAGTVASPGKASSSDKVASGGNAARENTLPEVTLEQQIAAAREMADRGRTNDALGYLESLAEGAGRLDHRVHFLMALIADHSGLILQAIESLKRAIFLSKNFVIGHYYLGVIYQREGDNAVAKRHFKNVIRLLNTMPANEELEEAEGVSAGRLKEIVESLFEEIDVI